MSLSLIQMQHEATLEHSLEGIDISKALSELPAQFKTMAGNTKDFITNLFKDNPTVSHLKADGNFDLWVNKMLYTSASTLDFACPIGLNVPVSDYLKVLDNVNKNIIEKMMSDALQPSLNWIARTLSDPKSLMSIRDHRVDSGVRFTDKLLDTHIDHLGKCFVKGGNFAKAPYNKLYRSNKDFKETVHEVNRLNDSLKKIDSKKVLEICDAITDGVNGMIQEIELGNPDYQINSKTMVSISDTLHLLAKTVSFYSHYSYLLLAMTKATEENIKRASELMK